MQKPFCDGCGREIEEGIPLVSLRAMVTPFTPGQSQEETAIITENYNRDYHADCWSERAGGFAATIREPDAYYLAGETIPESAPPISSEGASPETEPDAPPEDGTGDGKKGDTEEPVEPGSESGPEEKGAPLEVVNDERTPAEQSADSRGIAEPTIEPGVNP